MNFFSLLQTISSIACNNFTAGHIADRTSLIGDEQKQSLNNHGGKSRVLELMMSFCNIFSSCRHCVSR